MNAKLPTPMAKRQNTPARGALLQHAPADAVLGSDVQITPNRRDEGTTHGPGAFYSVVGACLHAIRAQNRVRARSLSLSMAPRLLWLLALGLCDLSLCAATLTPPPAHPPSAPQVQLPPGPDQPPPSELPKIVAALAAQPSLSAADCAKLAQETITHGQATLQSGQPAKPGVLNDGLAAVDRGEALDAKAADWPALRSQLQELLKPPPPQDKKEDKKEDEKKQDEKKEEQKKDEQQKDQQEKQDQKSQDKEQQQDQPQSEQQKQEQEKKEQEKQQQAQESDKPEPPKDTQSVGGEKPKDDERQEHPELAVPLQKLDQVRDKDSPAELFQLLHKDEPAPAGQPKKDW